MGRLHNRAAALVDSSGSTGITDPGDSLYLASGGRFKKQPAPPALPSSTGLREKAFVETGTLTKRDSKSADAPHRGQVTPSPTQASGRDAGAPFPRGAAAAKPQRAARAGISLFFVRIHKTVMILPQVHLRKPCYDFYFL